MVRPAAVVTQMTDTTRAKHIADADDSLATADHPPMPSPGALPPAQHDPFEPDFAPVIRSKIQPPALRSTTLTRQRLIDRLHEATASRVTLIVAEAGYGKTTLLADFAARSGQRTLWYRLDPTDADAITWTNYLIAACRELMPHFGRATQALLAQVGAAGPPNHVFVASLIDELRQLGEAPTLLVLDDFHAVDSSSEAREIVERLLRDAPPWMHLVIAARRRPTLRFGRVEAMGNLAAIGTDDLRFEVSETHDLFADRYNMPLEDDVLEIVDHRTRGWAASLQLFYGSIRNKPLSAARSLASLLSGAESPIYDFLAEEVLANVPAEVEALLVRASILDRVLAGHAVELWGEGSRRPTTARVNAWIEEADHLGLLSRSSESSDARQIHPLLRDFLGRRLRSQMDREAIAVMHVRLARAVQRSDPLTAARHFLEAGEDLEAMRCLGGSVMQTMGSGQWGVASDLIDRLKGVPADPAVAAIQSRRYIEEGDLDRAARLLAGVDATNAPADVRAVFRHAKVSLGWRSGDRELIFSTLDEIRADDETPPILRDIFQVFFDASPLSLQPVPFAALSRRMEQMSRRQAEAGHTYYAAISLHNAAVAAQAAGEPTDAIRLGHAALAAYENLSASPSEMYSTHAVLAGCFLELGNRPRAEHHINVGTSTGKEHGDVLAELAFLCAVTGQRERAMRMLEGARVLQRHGLSDIQGITIGLRVEAFLSIASHPEQALELLAQIPDERPLDVGDTLNRLSLEALAHFMARRPHEAVLKAQLGLDRARQVSATSTEAKLRLVLAISISDREGIKAGISDAAKRGELGLLEAADAIGRALNHVQPVPPELLDSMRAWPERWLPVLRRELETGNSATGRVAARLLDEVGAFDDVVRLRAYAKTYGRKTRPDEDLGFKLARRVAPQLEISDLGRVVLKVGHREVALSKSRRKAAALLMFLITRPRFTATREQVLDELWPDADPLSASNSLNQSLYFLRRDIEPWYEDGMSVDYVHFEGDLVWLDADLTKVQSVSFLQAVRDTRRVAGGTSTASATLAAYTGRFAPEFEYDEWAMGWRQRLHAEFLELAAGTMDQLESSGDLSDARDIASHVLEVDSSAREIEQRLVRIYWRLGARSAASAQYDHLASLDRADGLEPPSLRDVTGR